MGTMYKEIVARRRAPVVVGIFIVMALMIAVSNIMEQIQIADYKIGFITNPLIFIATFSIIGFEVFRCKVSYRYSIIADQLIIHRLKDKEQNVEENIKLKDIVFLGKVKDMKEQFDIAKTRRYVCSALCLDNYCCIYKDGDKYRRFYFQPSSNLINRMKKVMEK